MKCKCCGKDLKGIYYSLSGINKDQHDNLCNQCSLYLALQLFYLDGNHRFIFMVGFIES